MQPHVFKPLLHLGMDTDVIPLVPVDLVLRGSVQQVMPSFCTTAWRKRSNPHSSISHIRRAFCGWPAGRDPDTPPKWPGRSPQRFIGGDPGIQGNGCLTARAEKKPPTKHVEAQLPVTIGGHKGNVVNLGMDGIVAPPFNGDVELAGQVGKGGLPSPLPVIMSCTSRTRPRVSISSLASMPATGEPVMLRTLSMPDCTEVRPTAA
jgi:hypothetical protein